MRGVASSDRQTALVRHTLPPPQLHKPATRAQHRQLDEPPRRPIRTRERLPGGIPGYLRATVRGADQAAATRGPRKKKKKKKPRNGDATPRQERGAMDQREGLYAGTRPMPASRQKGASSRAGGCHEPGTRPTAAPTSPRHRHHQGPLSQLAGWAYRRREERRRPLEKGRGTRDPASGLTVPWPRQDPPPQPTSQAHQRREEGEDRPARRRGTRGLQW